MNLQRLFLIHAIITFAAGVVLIIVPTVIPETVDIQLTPEQYLLCYFLGAAELGIAYLSFFGRTITDGHALRIITKSFIVFHAATGLLELYGLTNGLTPKIIGNVILRVIIVILFYYYGLSKKRIPTNQK